MLQTIIIGCSTGLIVLAAQLYIVWSKRVRAVGNFPGYRTLIDTVSVWNELLPAIPGIAAGRFFAWKRKYEDYKKWGRFGYVNVSLWPGAFAISVADAQTIKEIASMRSRYLKPVELYEVVSFLGKNIVATENDEWKKHRKIAAPAFSEPNNKLVCLETVEIMNGLFEEMWQEKEEIDYDDATNIMVEITLLIIGRAAFGRKVSWGEDSKVPPGYNMSFKDSLLKVSSNLLVKFITPNWAYGLYPRLRHIQNAFADLPLYIQDMIDECRKEQDQEERSDLLTRLVEVSGQEKGAAKLLDSEIVGNIFIFLVAGHETTAHTLGFSLALLALYPKEQDILFQHIKSVLSDGRDPTYEDLSNLTQTLAVFYETLRMFPPVLEIPKYAAEESTISFGSADGTRHVVRVPKSARVSLSIVGMHYNPHYWGDPYEFRPQRFNEDWPHDAFFPFSGGARACLGRRFSETEAVVILTMLVARYKIEIQDEPRFAHETFEQRKERVLRAKPGITVTPVRVPLVFRRR